MGDFIAENWQFVSTLIFGAAVLVTTLRISINHLDKKIDTQTSWMREQFSDLNDKDDEHDSQLSAHDKEIAVMKKELSMLTGWFKEMRTKIDKIYDKVIGGK